MNENDLKIAEKNRKIEDEVVQSKDAKRIYKFAKENKDANIERLQGELMKVHSGKYLYLFAKNVKGANIEKMQALIVNNCNSKFIYLFAKDIQGANIDILRDAIYKTNDLPHIFFFEIKCNGSLDNVEKLAFERNDVKTLYLLGLYHHKNGENIDKYTKAILDANLSNKEETYLQSYPRIVYLNDADKELFKEKILNTKDPEIVYLFARHVELKDVSDLEDKIIQLRNEKYIYKFAKDVKNCDITKLIKGMRTANKHSKWLKLMEYLPIDHDAIEELKQTRLSKELKDTISSEWENLFGKN